MTKENEINFEQILNLIKSFALDSVMISYYNPDKNMNVFYGKYKIIILSDIKNVKRNPFIKDNFGNTILIKFTS